MSQEIFDLVDNSLNDISKYKERIKKINENLVQIMEANKDNSEILSKLYWEYEYDKGVIGEVIKLIGRKNINAVAGHYVFEFNCIECNDELEVDITSKSQLEYYKALIKSEKKKHGVYRQHFRFLDYKDIICDDCLEKERKRQEDERKLEKEKDRLKQETKELEIQKLRVMPYKDYLQTEHWKTLRKKKLRKANFKCELCSTGGKLNVHHRTYENRGNAELEIKDLIVLCEQCHGKFHDKIKGE